MYFEQRSMVWHRHPGSQCTACRGRKCSCRALCFACRSPFGSYDKRPVRTVLPSLLGLVAAAMLVLSLSSDQGMLGLCTPTNLAGQPGSKAAPTTLAALRSCTDFRCLREAHALPRGRGQMFNFPHFFIIGT